MTDTRPLIAVSMGDPAGIGAEVLVRALADPRTRALARFRVYGVGACMEEACRIASVEPFWWRTSSDADVLRSTLSHDVTLVDHAWSGRPKPGASISKETGALSFEFVERAIADAMRPSGDPLRADAICTAPINKEAWALAGRAKYPGHTELLKARSNAKRVGMMFESPELRVILATAHIPLMDVRNILTIGRVFDAIDMGADACDRLGVQSPRIAVCGLNPHAGEGGLLGDEDERLIAPAIELAQSHGIDATGPHPADTVFNRAIRGDFDLVVAMYHDQGLIPVKLLAWDRAVNVSVGLPFARTSPDHGTALDIAWKGKANPGSTAAALRLAVKLAQAAAADA